MSSCTNKRFEKQLYAYELGMLSPAEQSEMEIHLYECEHCFHLVQQFHPVAQHLRHNPRVREQIRMLDQTATPPRIQTDTISSISSTKWARIVPPLLAAAAILLILLSTDWQIVFRPGNEAMAVEKRVAVMYFVNYADQEDSLRLGEIAANLLITDLAESHYLQVVSSQRLHDILKLLGYAETGVVDQLTASQVASKAGADWMLMGCILQVEPRMEISAQLFEVASGEVAASQRITGVPGEDLFSLLDKLTIEIKHDLALPAAAAREPDPRVADVTTSSTVAYRYYLEGVDYLQKYYLSEASNSFQKALEYDSTFAMVYYYLASLVDIRLIDKAVLYAKTAGRKEQFYIESRKAALQGDLPRAMAILQEAVDRYPEEKDAFYMLGSYSRSLGHFDQAIEYLNRAIDIDPQYKPVYNLLAYAYNDVGNMDQSIRLINQYITLAPQDANPYDSRGDIYAANGRFAEAIESYRSAVEMKPDFNASWLNLGNAYLMIGQYIEAGRCFQQLARGDRQNIRSEGRLYLGSVPLFQGKFEQALRTLEDGIAADALEGTFDWSNVRKHYLHALLQADQGACDTALQEIDTCLAIRSREFPDEHLGFLADCVSLLAKCGELSRAEHTAEMLGDYLGRNGFDLRPYWYARGAIAFAYGDHPAATHHLEQASEGLTDLSYSYLLAQVYLRMERYDDAATTLETIVSHPDFWKLLRKDIIVKTHYFLGVAYEQSNRPGEAIEQYRVFLNLWIDADSGIFEREDARERLARLANG